MTSQVLNFLWINLDLPAPADPAEGGIRPPMPAAYIDNVCKAAVAQPQADIHLWVDSQRLTGRQMEYLKARVEAGSPNARVMDLRSIHSYGVNPLYNFGEGDAGWRDRGQRSLIWRQVDAAKTLVSIQGGYDQVFFADLDHAGMDINAPELQAALEKNGIFVGNNPKPLCASNYENQVWGFTPRRQEFFEHYYEMALDSARQGENGWMEFVFMLEKELEIKEDIPHEEISFAIPEDGSRAEHPGHAWSAGDGSSSSPALISEGELTKAFERAGKAKAAPPRRAKSAAPSL